MAQCFSVCSYMVDAADPDKIEPSRNELHHLLDKPQLQGIPVLVLGIIIFTCPNPVLLVPGFGQVG
jgi:hypothetical protein